MDFVMTKSPSPAEQYALARRLVGTEETAKKGFAHAMKAAEAGHAEAATLLGDFYQHGLGTPPDEQESLKWYRRGAELGDGAGYAALGQRYVDDMGNVSDPILAKAWFEKAIELGYQPAASFLAKILMDESDPPDMDRGMQILLRAADAHDFGACLRLSSIYRHGRYGIAPNADKAEYYGKLSLSLAGKPSRGS